MKAIVDSRSSRNSAFELLRVICMFAIVANHILSRYRYGYVEDYYPAVFAFIYPLFQTAVDCFLLISGFFSIRLKATKLFSLFFVCATYGLIGYIIHVVVSGASIGRSILNNTLFVFSDPPGWWFIKYYVVLFLISPFLNRIVEILNQNQFIVLLATLFVVNSYFGWYRQDPTFDSGFSIQHFVFIYLLGRFIRIHPIRYTKMGVCRWCLMGNMIFCGFGLINYLYFGDNQFLLEGCHGHPLIIFNAVCLFLLFSKLSIQSETINCFGKSSFAVYLIHANCYISPLFFTFATDMVPRDEYGILSLLSILGMSMLATFLFMVVDMVRRLISQPIEDMVAKALIPVDARISSILETF